MYGQFSGELWCTVSYSKFSSALALEDVYGVRSHLCDRAGVELNVCDVTFNWMYLSYCTCVMNWIYMSDELYGLRTI